MKQAGVALLLLGGMGTAGAALLPAVNGQVYDDVLEISWLQDANFVKTSCDDNNALWQAFEPPLVIDGGSGRSKTEICDDWNGRLNWNEAEGWIAVLNANNHLGHGNWRQPATGPVDGSAFDYDYDFAYDGSTDRGYNISGPGSAFPGSTGSELAYMHYNNLGNPSSFDTAGNNQQAAVCPAPNFCMQNTEPFENLQSFWYWSGTVYAPSPSFAWVFYSDLGFQSFGVNIIFDVGYVWPVRPGQDVGAPAPASIPVLPWWGLMLMGLGLAAVARRRLR